MLGAIPVKLKRGEENPFTGLLFWAYTGADMSREIWLTPDKFLRRKHKHQEAGQRRNEKIRSSPELLRQKREAEYASRAKYRGKAGVMERRRFIGQVYYGDNKERIRPRQQLWESKNREKRSDYCARRRALLANAACNNSPEDNLTIRVIFRTRARVSRCLGIEFHVDHIVPLERKGPHHPGNLQLLPATINLSKGDKLESEFPYETPYKVFQKILLTSKSR